MGRHYHDPYRPHAARPVEDPPLVPAPAPLSVRVASGDPAPFVEPLQDPSDPEDVTPEADVDPEATPDVDEDPEPVEVVEPMDPPPQVGPGSSADAWRAYAAEVTGTPPETWAESSRTVVIQVLREQGYAVDQSGVPGS